MKQGASWPGVDGPQAIMVPGGPFTPNESGRATGPIVQPERADDAACKNAERPSRAPRRHGYPRREPEATAAARSERDAAGAPSSLLLP
jgi:hypothetical protein